MLKSFLNSWLLSFVLFFLFTNQINAQKTIWYSGEAQKRIEFDEIRYLPTGDSILSIQDAKRNLKIDKFKINTLTSLNLGIAKDNFWVNFTIGNKSEKEISAFLILENPRLNAIDVYLLRSDSVYSTLQLGDNFPFGNRPINYNEFAFQIKLKMRDTVSVFMLVKHKGNTLQMPITIRNTNSLLAKAETNYLITGFVSGIFFIASIFGLFFLYNTRDPLFISYSGYMITAGLWIWATEGFAFQFLWPNSPELATRLGPGISAVSACFFIANCLQFTKPYDIKSPLRKILTGILVLLVGWSLAPFITIIPLTEGKMSVYLTVYFSSNIVIAILMVIYLLELVKNGYRIVLYFFFAVITTIFCAVVVVSKGSGVITIPFSSSTVMSSGYLVELILMTAGITKQFYNYRKEKEEALLAYLEQQKTITQKILETQEAERKRIGSELHDDIGAGLTQISLMSEAAKNYALSDKSNIRELDDIAGTSRHLVQNMSEIIWALQPDNKTLNQLVIYMREQLHKLLEYSGIHYEIVFPKLEEEIPLSNVHLRNILLIVKESVNNSIKHSNANNIQISCGTDEKSIWFSISDDGKGINVDQIKSGNGIVNMKRRAAEIKGRFELISGLEKGLTCKLTIML